MKRFSRAVVAGFLLVTMCLPIQAEPAERRIGTLAYLPALAGDYFALESQQVGRTFHIYVRLPEGYDDPANANKLYPTVYLLDGDSTFPMLAPLHLFMTYDDEMPEAIIVGIAYGGFDPSVNKRDVDFRMVMDDGSAGGAPCFLRMLRSELFERIQTQYRTDPARRIIVGQSRGGSAVLQAAWLEPGMFWGHIASNPGREPDTKLLFGMDRAPAPRPRDGWVIVASGSEDRDYLRATALEWRDQIASRDDLPWNTRFINVEGGTHAADLSRVYREAMRLMFVGEAAVHQVDEQSN